MTCRVDGFGRLTSELRVVGAAADDVDDQAILDADVGAKAICAGAVDDSATGDLRSNMRLSLSPWAVGVRRAGSAALRYA
jgi:hypothetical protein